MPTLTSARVKLDWAKNRFETLQGEITSWIDSNPCGIGIESDSQGSEHRFVLNIRNPPNVDRWGCLFGDCAHNLRSALDHAVWALSASSARGHSEFPIFADPIIYTPSGTFRKDYARKIEGITNYPIRDFIEACQPCRTANPRQAALWVVHRIDIVDKHHSVVPVLLENLDPQSMNISLRFADDAARMAPPHAFIKNPEPVGDGDTLLTMLTVPGVEHVEANVGFGLKIGVDVGALDVDLGMPYSPIVSLLSELGPNVDTVITELERLTI